MLIFEKNFISMKIFKILPLVLYFFSMISCGSDDDICMSGDATPRMKIKFKTLETGKLKTLDSLYVDVDYGTKTVTSKQANADSILIPLRVDDNPYTDFSVRTSYNGTQSKIRINYTSKTAYVSPACGVKKLYENVGAELITPDPVQKVETNQTAISDENKTVLYLDF
jgi:hypothetical protein